MEAAGPRRPVLPAGRRGPRRAPYRKECTPLQPPAAPLQPPPSPLQPAGSLPSRRAAAGLQPPAPPQAPPAAGLPPASPQPPPGSLVGRRVAVVGLQRSNAAVVRYLRSIGAQVEAYDAKTAEHLQPYAAALPPGAPLFAGPDYLDHLRARLDGLAAVFVTPGMRKDAPVLAAAAAAGATLWTEAAYVLQIAPCPVIGITGSAGKTTTTTLVGEAISRWRPGSLIGGNIGLPVIDRLHTIPPGAWLVLELSSFQLELARRAPDLAAVLNVRPNHLDIHGTYAAYVEAKRNIYRRQVPGDWALFGTDDPEAARLAVEAPSGALAFRGTGPVAAGAGVEAGAVRWYPPRGVRHQARPDGGPHPYARAVSVLPLSAIAVAGAHNVQNVAAAAALALAAGVPPRVITAVVSTFRGVQHRQELVRQWHGVRWINDSIATAPDRTLAALETFAGSPLVLLAGGYDKGIPFDDLGAAVGALAERVILFGATAGAIAAAIPLGAAVAVERVPDLAAAVAAAAAGARPGQVVLLSPACASYDQFRDFEERGQRFKAYVAALPE